jgi:protein transport protein SEC61 subunit gamma-like protein
MEEIQEQKPTLWQKFRRFVLECRRVLLVTKKPTSYEFKTIVKVSGLGMIIIGLMGFILRIIKQLLL